MTDENNNVYVNESEYKLLNKISDSCSSNSESDVPLNDTTNSNNTTIIIVCLVIVIIILVSIIAFLCMKRYKIKKREKEDDLYISVLSKSMCNIDIDPTLPNELRTTDHSSKSLARILEELESHSSRTSKTKSISSIISSEKSFSSIISTDKKPKLDSKSVSILLTDEKSKLDSKSVSIKSIDEKSKLDSKSEKSASEKSSLRNRASVISNSSGSSVSSPRLSSVINTSDDSIIINALKPSSKTTVSLPSDKVESVTSMKTSSSISEKHGSLSSSIRNSRNSIHNTVPITSPEEKLHMAKCEDISLDTSDNDKEESLKVDLPSYSEAVQNNYVIYNPILVQYQIPQTIQAAPLSNFNSIGYNIDQKQRILINNTTIINNASSSIINNSSLQAAPIQNLTSQSIQNLNQNYTLLPVHHSSPVSQTLPRSNRTTGPIFYNNKLVNSKYVFGSSYDDSVINVNHNNNSNSNSNNNNKNNNNNNNSNNNSSNNNNNNNNNNKGIKNINITTIPSYSIVPNYLTYGSESHVDITQNYSGDISNQNNKTFNKKE
ncbi:hypothetical protein PIROE2DRAFT_10795 [Piromyces sp. E2]|nr:hypothetical protein PIROE2DRAFT_10795 [Piromyces sp. E2]|eukprot:OUM62817.1 hypothetical protein PIROE2DRAFT_10795 [Piromyces sp. E2]